MRCSMSLMRQLWLIVIVSTITAFAGSLLVSIWSAQGYLTQQLGHKNEDVASSLALSMTQQAKDQVTIDLQVAALFDTGYYQMIAVTDPFHNLIAQRVQEAVATEVPSWFIKAFPIESLPGQAQINDNWKQYGTVTVISHTHFASHALWKQAGRLLLWFFCGGLGVGGLGMLMLRAIDRSLREVIDQAAAISDRRFITIAEPRTPELGALARAMNSMVERLRQMFNEAATGLEDLLRQVHYDRLTKLPNREYFLAYLQEQLTGNQAPGGGVLAVMRLADLNTVNAKLGRSGTDRMLEDLGQMLTDFAQAQSGGLSGRIKAGDFAMVLPGANDAQAMAQNLDTMCKERFLMQWQGLGDIYHLGVICFKHGDGLSQTLAQVDYALALAEDAGINASHVIAHDTRKKVIPGEQWRELLTQAVSSGNVKLAFYPVITQEGRLLHQEGMARLQLPEPEASWLVAGDFLPMAARLHLTTLIDLEVIRLALGHLPSIAGDVAVNLAAETITSWAFRTELTNLLSDNPKLCPRLWFEVTEYAALKHFDALKDLFVVLKNFGCRVGIEQFGQQLTASEQFTELGLDYIKLHPGLIADIETNGGNQEFIRRFCGIAHTFGMLVLATGVGNKAALSTLTPLGIDGATGPGIHQ